MTRDDDTAPGWTSVLDSGETILWQGRPDARIAWRDILQIESLGGASFLVFALIWTAGASVATTENGEPVPRSLFLFMVPFVAIGLWLLVGRLAWDALVRSRTHYLLTDRAAYIRGGLPLARFERFPIHPAMPLTLNDHQPGSVWFAQRTVYRIAPKGGFAPSETQVGFRRIPDARNVWRLLRDAIDAQARPAA